MKGKCVGGMSLTTAISILAIAVTIIIASVGASFSLVDEKIRNAIEPTKEWVDDNKGKIETNQEAIINQGIILSSHGSQFISLHDRLDRIEDKLDRLIQQP